MSEEDKGKVEDGEDTNAGLQICQTYIDESFSVRTR